MRRPVMFAASLILAAPLTAAAGEASRLPHDQWAQAHSQALEMSGAQRKKRASGQQAYGQSRTQIACTPAGCHPIPPGCRIRTGYNPFTWDPTGFDEVVCPYRR